MVGSVSLKAYAKINLGLRVLGRRRDGFHELRTIYQTISLADRLEVRLAPGPPQVRLETFGFDVPPGRQNLAVRSAEAVLQELRVRSQVLVRLQKRVPPASGLGGASSDAATVIRALLYLTGRRLPMERMLRLATALGSDVPFFLFGGRALGLGRGEEVYPLPEGPGRSVVVFFPGEGMATAEAFRRLRRPLLTARDRSPTIEWFCSRANEAAWDRLENDFEPVVFRVFSRLRKAKNTLLQAGAETAALTGSGSAVFGIFEKYSQARQVWQRLCQSADHVFLARTVSRRAFQASFPTLSPSHRV